jgi:hypothetical protein
LLDRITRLGCLLAGHQWDVTDRAVMGPEVLEQLRCRHCGAEQTAYRPKRSRRPW